MSILGHTKVLGVFGHPISHSLSPVMHNAAIEALNIDFIYVPFHVEPDSLGSALEGIRAMEIAGVNLTIPHKEAVIQLLDEVEESADRIQSVNTIVNDGGTLKGRSTDGPGFLKSAEEEWGKLDGCKVLMLGAGGSAKAVAFTLAEIGCEVVVANRTRSRGIELAGGLMRRFGKNAARAIGLEAEELAEAAGKADLVVNTTSVGMHPNVEGIPIPAGLLRPGMLVYDLIYNPMRTRLLIEAEAKGARVANGLGMLVHQGALSFEMWTGIYPPTDVMAEAVRKSLMV